MGASLPFEFDFSSPDYGAVFKNRAEKLKRIRENPKCLPGLFAYYKENIAQFIIDWGMTSDTRNADIGLPVVVPFLLFDRQTEWVDWLNERWHGREDGLTEKSRDMGLSWLSVAVGATICLFNRDVNIGYGSRKEEYVDKIGDPKCLFYKARQFIKLLPPEFTGGWSDKKNSSHMVLKFNNGSTMTGEAGDNIGRGNRASIYFKDESAFYERPELIDAALSQTSNCKIDISTPNGNGNPFYKKRHSGKVNVFTFQWTDDPRKDQAWYEDQKQRLDPAVLAQEVDLDYTASVTGLAIPGKWVQAAVNLHQALGLRPSGMKRAGLDVADEEGRDLNAFVTVYGTTVQEIESWNGLDTTQTTHRANALADDYSVTYINYDSIGVGAGVRGAAKGIVRSFNGVATSESPRPGAMINNRDKLNKDAYLNLRAQLWWEARIRFERAYQHLNGIAQYSLDEMISIPNNAELINELSRPKYKYTDAGKIKIEGKPEMKKRGIESPNIAEAALLAFVAPKKRKANTNYQQTSTEGWT